MIVSHGIQIFILCNLAEHIAKILSVGKDVLAAEILTFSILADNIFFEVFD